MSEGGFVGLWRGLTGTVGNLPENINESISTVKWLGIISVVVVGGAILMISLSFVTGRQNMADVISSVK